MNKLFFAAAALAGFSAVPALAADVFGPPAAPRAVVVQRGPQVQAWLGTDAGWTQIESSGTTIPGYTLSASGAANVPMGAFNLEIEARGTDANITSGGTAADIGIGSGYLHAFWRSPGAALGGFVGFEDDAVIGLRTFGVEGQLYMAKINLYGQVAGIAPASGGVAGVSSAWFGRVGLQWFLNPNFLIGGDYRFVTISGSGTSLNTNLFQVNAEWRGMGNPLSLYANASIQTLNQSGTTASVSRVVGGVRIHLGNGSLQEQYSTGASMNVIPSVW
jgi:hypothetical protein